MDVLIVTLAGLAAVSTAFAAFAWLRNRRHATAIDDAIRRIGGADPQKKRRRSGALSASLDRLERSTAVAQRERARLAGAVQAAPIGIVVTDDQGVVVSGNPAAEQFLGTTLGEAVAQVRVREAIEEAILGRSAVDVEVELYTPTRAVLEVSAIPLDFGVESVGAVAFISDVTETRRVAAMRRDFVANVGHELKTPLAALAALAETLADSASQGPTATLAERLRHESNRLARLVGDILDLSQAEALASQDEPVSIGPLVAGVVDELAPLASERKVIVTTPPPPAGARVAGDSRQLRSLFTNLIENAIKYSVPQGDATATVTIAIEIVDDRLLVHVRDEGIGIPDGHLDRIFERFYRVDRGRSRETGGTGLGLSIARHIAAGHRGTITVESKEGEGSTFTVDLPLWSAP